HSALAQDSPVVRDARPVADGGPRGPLRARRNHRPRVVKGGMSYTPVELRHIRVGRALLGYKRSAVENLLSDVAASFETVWRERHELADHVETIETEIAELRKREQALTQTLLAAEEAATTIKEQAKKEAELIIAEAHQEARTVTLTAQSDRHRLLGDTHR